MTDKKRDPLPEGYQFGDAHEHDYRACYVAAGFVYHAICRVCGHDAGAVNVDRVTMVEGIGHWNVIEGEHFASGEERHQVIEGEPTA